MNARDAFLQVLADSGLSIREITRRLNRAPGYFTHITKKGGGTPGANMLGKVANVCGYDLILRRRIDDYEIPIDEFDD